MGETSTGVGLAEAIGQLRREITDAMRAAEGETLQFALGPIELELQVQVALKGSATVGGKWFVVSIDAEAGAERTQTHSVKLVLTPKAQGSEDVRVSDRSAPPD